MVTLAAAIAAALDELRALSERAKKEARQPVRDLVAASLRRAADAAVDALACEDGRDAGPEPCPRCNGSGRVHLVADGTAISGPCGMCHGERVVRASAT